MTGSGGILGRNYLTYSTALGLSATGDPAWFIALTWYLTEIEGTALAAFSLALTGNPVVVGLLWSGPIANRWPARCTMIGCDIPRSCVLTVIAGVAFAELDAVSFVAGTLAASLLSSVFMPS